MDDKKVTVITTILGAIGVILLLMSAFDIIPSLDNVLIFVALVCFILVGVVKKLVK